MAKKIVRISIDAWRRLNLNSPKTMLEESELANLQNFMLRRGGSIMLRPGYARFVGGSTSRVLTQQYSNDWTGLALLDNVEDEAEWTGYGTTPETIEVITTGPPPEIADNGTSICALLLEGTSLDADQYAEGILQSSPVSFDYSGIMVRGSSSGGYVLQILPNTARIRRVTDWATGVGSILATASISYTPPTTFRLEVIGTELRAYMGGSVILQVEDTNLTAGDAGFQFVSIAGASGSWATFLAGDASEGVRRQVQVTGTPGRAFHFERDDNEVMLVVEHGGKFQAFKVGQTEWVE